MRTRIHCTNPHLPTTDIRWYANNGTVTTTTTNNETNKSKRHTNKIYDPQTEKYMSNFIQYILKSKLFPLFCQAQQRLKHTTKIHCFYFDKNKENTKLL